MDKVVAEAQAALREEECGIQSLIIFTHLGKPLLHFQRDSTGAHQSYDVTALGRCIVSLQSFTESEEEGGEARRGHVGRLRVGGMEFVVLGPYEEWRLSAVLLTSALTPTVTLKGLQVLHAFVGLCGARLGGLVQGEELRASQRLKHTTAQSMLHGTTGSMEEGEGEDEEDAIFTAFEDAYVWPLLRCPPRLYHQHLFPPFPPQPPTTDPANSDTTPPIQSTPSPPTDSANPLSQPTTLPRGVGCAMGDVINDLPQSSALPGGVRYGVGLVEAVGTHELLCHYPLPCTSRTEGGEGSGDGDGEEGEGWEPHWWAGDRRRAIQQAAARLLDESTPKGVVIRWAHPRADTPNHAVLHRTNMPWLLLLLPFSHRLSPPYPPSPVMLLPLPHAPGPIIALLLPHLLRGLAALFPPPATLVTLGERGVVPSALPKEGEAWDIEGLGMSSPRMSTIRVWSPRALTFDDDEQEGDEGPRGGDRHVATGREEERSGGGPKGAVGEGGWGEGDREELERVLDLDEHTLRSHGLQTSESAVRDEGLRPPPLELPIGGSGGVRGEPDQETRRREEVVEVRRRRGLRTVLDRCVMVPVARVLGCCVSSARWWPEVAKTRRNSQR